MLCQEATALPVRWACRKCESNWFDGVWFGAKQRRQPAAGTLCRVVRQSAGSPAASSSSGKHAKMGNAKGPTPTW